MTGKRSQFGSLADRLGVSAGEAVPGPARSNAAPAVRHVWVDGVMPGLVCDRRRVDGVWHGLVVWVGAEGEVHQEWLLGERISKAS